MKIPSFLYLHTATVKAYLGSGAYGPIYGDPVEYKCRIEEKRSLVRNKEGKEVVSNTRGFFEYKGEEIPSESEIKWGEKIFKVIDSIPQTGLKKVSHIEVRM